MKSFGDLLKESKVIGEALALEAKTVTKSVSQLSQKESEQYNLDELAYKGLSQDIIERKKYAKLIFTMISIWLSIILVIVIFQGIECIPFIDYYFKLSEATIITLITTTTANIAAYFLVVTKYLFPNKK